MGLQGAGDNGVKSEEEIRQMLLILETFGPSDGARALRWALQTADHESYRINNMQPKHAGEPAGGVTLEDADLSVGAYNCLTAFGIGPTEEFKSVLSIEYPRRINYFGVVRFCNVVEQLMETKACTREELESSRLWKSAPAGWRRAATPMR